MKMNMEKAIGLGAAILTLTAGSAFAATTTGHLQVLAGPGDNYQQVGEINGEQSVSVLKTNGDWCEISSPKAGWVACAQLSDLPRTNQAPSLSTVPDFGSINLPGADPYNDPVRGNHS
jgi:uncharacterized protein YraI